MKNIDDIKKISKTHPVMVFDGECIFCCNALQFFIRIDENEKLRYTTLQSDAGQELVTLLDFSSNNDSVILVDNGELYTHTDVTFKSMSYMNYPWKILTIFKYIPSSIRNFFYKIIARNRYKWFGKRDQCLVPSEAQKHLFI